MFFLTDKVLFKRILPGFLFLGLFLRVVGLLYFPLGMEGDEAVVVYWGRKWIQEGQFLLVSFGELPAWETPAAYFFGGLDLLGVPPRWGAVALSFLEIGLCYGWTRRRGSARIALLSATFLALMPWHFFFSFVLGPCVAGLWTCLYLFEFKNALVRGMVTAGGLLYYASFRVLLFWRGLLSLCDRQWGRLGVDLVATCSVLGVLYFLEEQQFLGFFVKGQYLLERGGWEAAHHYLNAVLLWWTPPLQAFWSGLSVFSMDDVGFVFANLLGIQSPLSYGISIFFAVGLFICIKQRRHRDLAYLFVLSIIFIGFSPSYVHFPFLLPAVAFLAAAGALWWLEEKKFGRIFLLFTLCLALATLVYMISGFKSRDSWRTLAGDSENAALILKKELGQPFVWTAGVNFLKARLVADRERLPLTFFGTNQIEWLNRVQMLERQSGLKWVFIQANPQEDHPRTEIRKLLEEGRADYLKRLTLFENNHYVKSKKSIVHEGITLGVLYEVGD